ncbi:hypothetical protein F0T03_14210 [Yersinia canariae]|uniref:Uncharacterized protein n=1 Tax=Yersinia canariae TaxID=2607663 RepID=A0A857F645_9GAMM|nr:hypothetical protein F0T03_14210 [Yersinia canariae]
MLTQDYVSWVVIGAIDSTTDQLLRAMVCFLSVNRQSGLIYGTDKYKKSNHMDCFFYIRIGSCHKFF